MEPVPRESQAVTEVVDPCEHLPDLVDGATDITGAKGHAAFREQ